MDAIQFNAIVSEEQVIRPPAGVSLPEGEIEVTVRRREAAASEPGDLAATRSWLLALAAAAEQAAPDLPADLAENHDHYAHGKPRS
ncbi:MAG: hypothetical protein U0793_32705 [Gemmataceae bacterium]